MVLLSESHWFRPQWSPGGSALAGRYTSCFAAAAATAIITIALAVAAAVVLLPILLAAAAAAAAAIVLLPILFAAAAAAAAIVLLPILFAAAAAAAAALYCYPFYSPLLPLLLTGCFLVTCGAAWCRVHGGVARAVNPNKALVTVGKASNILIANDNARELFGMEVCMVAWALCANLTIKILIQVMYRNNVFKQHTPGTHSSNGKVHLLSLLHCAGPEC